jgi:hypothetical protein
MKLNHIKILRKLLLQNRVLSKSRERTRRAERSAFFEMKVLFEVKRRNFTETRDECFSGTAVVGDSWDLAVSVFADFVEAVEGIGEGREIRKEIGSGESGGGFGGGDRGEFGRGDCGGRERVVEDWGEIGLLKSLWRKMGKRLRKMWRLCGWDGWWRRSVIFPTTVVEKQWRSHVTPRGFKWTPSLC